MTLSKDNFFTHLISIIIKEKGHKATLKKYMNLMSLTELFNNYNNKKKTFHVSYFVPISEKKPLNILILI